MLDQIERCKREHMSHGFYRVTDVDARHLAKIIGAKLPRNGYELVLYAPSRREYATDGGARRWLLTRTPVSHDAYGFKAPERGWVWAVYST